ncbi:putative F-box protein At5g55150 [Silene latifolia]|uniref:putative F-box protein At5g55150 n=1 Tax=Silene latifolia TaxID=37657 RepID=UPI003D7832A0
MIIYQANKYLAFARQGDQSWTDILIKETRINIFDVVAMDDHVYVVYDDGEIAYWNVNEFYGLEAIKPMDYSPDKCEIFEADIRTVYLIQSGSDLLMVVRYKENVMNELDTNYDYDIIYRTIYFQVYKLNPKEKKWEYIEDLGDVMLFVGDNSSMSTLLVHNKCLQRNCIYFTDDESVEWPMVTEGGGHDMGVYDIKYGQLVFLSMCCNSRKKCRIQIRLLTIVALFMKHLFFFVLRLDPKTGNGRNLIIMRQCL